MCVWYLALPMYSNYIKQGALFMNHSVVYFVTDSFYSATKDQKASYKS